MSRVGRWLLAFAVAAGLAAQDEAAAVRPRLLVLCSVDQLATWVFVEGEPFFAVDGGFRRLLRDGAWFPHCAYQHACTETGPGHATIGTGVPASVHGIVRNKWWVPAEGKGRYCVDHPQAALPDLAEGRDRGPGLLLAPAWAAALKAAVPGARAGSVAWKDRAAILMGGAAADLVVWCEAATGRFVTNTAWTGRTPEWLSRWNATRPLDAFFGWRWERSGPAAAYDRLLDDRPYELVHANGLGQRVLPQALTGGEERPGPAFYNQVYGAPPGNTVVRQAAEAMLLGMDLGRDDATDLLCVSFSSTDVIGHWFGADSVEARDALLRLDQELGALLRSLDQHVGAGRWALFLTADHGVCPTPEWARERGLDAGRGAIQTMVAALAEKTLATEFGKPPAGRRYLSHVGEFSCFFDDATLDAVRGERDLAAIRLLAARAVAAAAPRVRGVQAAFATADLLAEPAAADPLRASLVAGLCPGRGGEVQFVVRPYWLDGNTPASHGTPHAYDREVVGMALGPGVPAGARIDAAITPGFGVVWFAHLLGLPPPPGAPDTLPAALRGR